MRLLLHPASHRDLAVAAISGGCIVAVPPSAGPVSEFCAQLDQLRIESGTEVRLLARQLGLSRAQLYAILAGTIKRPPDWDRVVRPLVRACARGDPGALAAWRRRHAVLTGVWEELRRRDQLPAAGAKIGRPAQATELPQQLPAAVACFTGRDAELAALTGLLFGRSGARPPAVVISAIGGTAGVGKTALAVHWAHQVAGRFPDGQLYVNLRGYDPGEPVPPGDALAGFLRALGVPGQDIPPEADERAGLFRSLLAGRQILLLLDNAGSVEQVRPLLPGTRGCAVLVTSRDALTGLVARDGARRLDLHPLPQADAVGLLRALIGGRVDADRQAAAALAAQCCRLPLALRVAAELAAARPAVPLADLTGELTDQQRRLDQLDAGGDPATAIRAVFSWSYRHLAPDTARAFRLAGLHPGPDLDPCAAAALTATSLQRASQLLDQLALAHLIHLTRPGRFAMHDLLRAYAADELRDHEDDAEQLAATRRVLDYYVHTAHSAALAINPARDALELAPASAGAVPERINERGRANDWFRAEYQVLLKVIELAAENGLEDYAWQIPWTLVNFFDQQGYWQDWVATHQIALNASQRSDNLLGQASAHQNISIVYVHLRCYEDAQAHLQLAITLNRRLGIRAGQARCLLDIARTFESQDRYHDALEHASTALSLYTELGHQFGQARALNAVGWSSAHIGDARRAIACCKQALEIHGKLGNRMGQAATLDSLGYAHTQLGQHADAIGCYQRALDLLGRAERTYQVACVLTNLATSYQAARNNQAAARASQDALSILLALRHPDIDRTKSRFSDAGIPGR